MYMPAFQAKKLVNGVSDETEAGALCELPTGCKPKSQVPTTNPVAVADFLNYGVASVNAGMQRACDCAAVVNACGPGEHFRSRADVLVE